MTAEVILQQVSRARIILLLYISYENIISGDIYIYAAMPSCHNHTHICIYIYILFDNDDDVMSKYAALYHLCCCICYDALWREVAPLIKQ